MSSVGVVLRGARRVFDGRVEAIRDLDVEIAAGEFVAILGPSGCGKSTLLRVVAGLESLDGGSVAVGGGRTARAAFVFQDAHLLPWRTVEGNVEVPLELQGVARAERRERARRAIERVGLTEAAGRHPAELSGGMRMRASLARALVNDPELLLLDEPFAALDDLTRQHLDTELRELWSQRRMTVLFVTHSILEASFLADRAIVLTRGPARIVLDHRSDLPPVREVALRTSAVFAREMRVLHDALARGEAA